MRIAVALGASAALLAIALAIQAPATLLDQRVAAMTGGRLRITNTEGTVWNGAGELVLLPSGARWPLAWHIDAGSLVSGELRGSMAGGQEAVRCGAFSLGHGDFALRDIAAALPAEALLRAGDAPSALASAGGRIELQVDELAKLGDTLKGHLVATWRSASLPALRPNIRVSLGDVRLELAGESRELRGALQNSGGDVDVVGSVAISVAGLPRLDAMIKPRPALDQDRADAIAAALNMLGVSDGQGAWRVSWTGTTSR